MSAFTAQEYLAEFNAVSDVSADDALIEGVPPHERVQLLRHNHPLTTIPAFEETSRIHGYLDDHLPHLSVGNIGEERWLLMRELHEQPIATWNVLERMTHVRDKVLALCGADSFPDIQDIIAQLRKHADVLCFKELDDFTVRSTLRSLSKSV